MRCFRTGTIFSCVGGMKARGIYQGWEILSRFDGYLNGNYAAGGKGNTFLRDYHAFSGVKELVTAERRNLKRYGIALSALDVSHGLNMTDVARIKGVQCRQNGGLFKHLNGFLWDSSSRGSAPAKDLCFMCILSVADQFLSFAAILNKSLPVYGNHRLLGTQASAHEQVLSSESLKQILIEIEKDPVSSKNKCASFIEKICRSGNLSEAFHLLRGLHDEQISLSLNTYNILLTAAGEAHNFKLSSLIFKDLFICNSPDSTSYSSVAMAFLKVPDTGLILKFCRELSEMTFPRSATVMNRLILGFAETGQIEKALMIFEDMRNMKTKPDTVTLNTILAILGKAGQIDKMLSEFSSMKESENIPDIITYNTLINSLRKVGRLDMCLIFFREMIARGIEPDLRSYTALIDSFGRSGQVGEALKLFGEMKQRRIQPSVYVYRGLISSLKKAGKVDLADKLADEHNLCWPKLIGPKSFKRKRR